MTDVQNVVLVHGGFVDGSGWRGAYDLLTEDGFNVSVVQNQTLSLESDAETTTNVLDLQDGPAILVGHSYGGAVITEAGRHQRVAGLVYIAAFCAGRGRVRQHAHRGPTPRRAGAADPAAAGRVPVPRSREVWPRRSSAVCCRPVAFPESSR
jgi:pimeloyl-ACP methyl ester carboxylesterase